MNIKVTAFTESKKVQLYSNQVTLVDSNSFIFDRSMHISHEEVPLKLKSKTNDARLSKSLSFYCLESVFADY